MYVVFFVYIYAGPAVLLTEPAMSRDYDVMFIFVTMMSCLFSV